MKRFKILVCSLVLAAAATSCDSFLSETPDNRTQLNTTQKVKDLLVFAYPSYHMASFLEAMSDNVTDSNNPSGGTRENDAYYLWEDADAVNTDTPSAYWDGCYAAIAQANEALNAISGFTETNETRGIKAEAYLTRAYAHFMLVNIFAKHYNPATASSDLGVPFVTEPERELIKKYERQSVQEVYDLIEQDLLAGLADAKLITYSSLPTKFHFGVEAARAFATRFYLYKGEFDKVLEYSSNVNGKPTNLRDYVYIESIPVNSRPANYASTDPKTNLLVTTVPSAYRRSFAYDRFSTEVNHITRTILGSSNNPFNKEFYYTTVRFIDEIHFVPKVEEYFKLTNPTAGTGFAFVQSVLFSNDEMFLARIEALAMENQLSEAVEGLGYFIGTRTKGYNAATDILTIEKLRTMFPNATSELTPYYTLSADQAVVVQAIAEARRRELIHEGNRWFDIKRFDMKVDHKIDQTTYTLEKGDLRRAFQLPQHVRDAGLTPNPR
ncbi:RagB/SusD family nutrient uptake outer membrane protein [Myroides sp. mNGS23_01]|nr:RagB/SusD family nutrient uptake outer membrane protein [Myroides sp. mNGS23_01]WHT37785.1 RagB/SusD family nutrient uptake outer membrane protein [Myroides sp. mNGS23_01]